MQAIDTTSTVLGNVHNVLNAGYHGIIRYVSSNTSNFPNKQLTSTEAAAIFSVPGMAIGLVYESLPTAADYFTNDQATEDAQRVLDTVGVLRVPTSVPVFFTVDYDAAQDDISGAILSYFTQIHTVLDQAGILVGVYGSGNTCQTMQQAGVVHYTWLSQSRGWGGYQGWKPSADIIQGPVSTVAGLDCDTDYVVNEVVLWTAS